MYATSCPTELLRPPEYETTTTSPTTGTPAPVALGNGGVSRQERSWRSFHTVELTHETPATTTSAMSVCKMRQGRGWGKRAG